MGSYLSLVALAPPPTTYQRDEPWLAMAGELAYTCIPGSSVALVLSHGNGYDLGTARHVAQMLHTATGCTVYAYEYPGYGPFRETWTSFQGATDALRAMVAHARTADHTRVVLVGHSIGSAPTCEVAADTAVDAVFLITPFTSLAATVTGVSLGVLDACHNIRHMPRIAAPVAVVHGTEDGVVPTSHGTELYEAAEHKAGLFILDGAGHNDVFATAHRDVLFAALQILLNVCD